MTTNKVLLDRTMSDRMRYRATVMSLLLFAASSAQAAEPGDASQALSRQVHAYFAGMGSGDIAGIERALAADYIVIGGDGKLETRAERLAWLRDNAKNVADIRPSQLLVRLYGNTGVVTGMVEIVIEAGAPTIRERFTQVWVMNGGVWRMVTGQITVVKE